MDNRAMKIAEKHLQEMNPSMWNGEGKRPKDFDTRIYTHPIDDTSELDISFEKDEDGRWGHLCELRDNESEELLEIVSGKGVNSVKDLADTIREACDGRID